MESENKQGLSSETISSDERSDQQVSQATTTTTTKRSYECTYCKRGFTNAQALGGHMNIHRKDRAKAKQHNNTNNPIIFSSNDFNHHQSNNNDHQEIRSNNFMANSLPFPTPTWYQPIDHHCNNHVDYHHHQHHHHHGNTNLLSDLSSGPSIASPFPFCYSNDNHQSNEELMGADLSLQIDSTPRFLGRDNSDDHEEVLDLELRLGYR